MNNGFTAGEYAEIVNVYGSRLAADCSRGANRGVRTEALQRHGVEPEGHRPGRNNFDVLGVHNYEYEPDSFETGLRRIRDYLLKLRDYVRASAHPRIEIGVLEWNLSRTYDWRAGLHAAGSLILYEELSPGTDDDLPGPAHAQYDRRSHLDVVHLPRPRLLVSRAAYPVEKLFRQHYAERYLASTSGTFRDIADRELLRRDRADEAGGLAAGNRGRHRYRVGRRPADRDQGGQLQRQSATRCSCGCRARAFRGGQLPCTRSAAGLNDSASLEQPDAIAPVERTREFLRDLTIDLAPFTVAVVEILAR